MPKENGSMKFHFVSEYLGPETFSGRGVSTDVVEGSARAFTAALNKALVDHHAMATESTGSGAAVAAVSGSLDPG